MTAQELLRCDDLTGGGTAFGVARCEEDIRQGNEEDVVVHRGTLGDDGALEEGGQEGV